MPGGRRPSLLGVVSRTHPASFFLSLSLSLARRLLSRRVKTHAGRAHDWRRRGRARGQQPVCAVWVVCKLLFSIVCELQKVGVLEVEVNSFECCVNLGLDYVANPEADFASLHPCPRAGPPLSGASPTSHTPTVPSHTSSQPL